MMPVKVAFAVLIVAVAFVQAKPSHPFGFPGVFDHLDLAPPVLPAAQFHAGEPAPVFPYHHHAHLLPPAYYHANHPLTASATLLPAPAPLFPAPAPLLPAPAHLLPVPAPLLPAPAPLHPAPAPLLPAPVIHTQTHFIPAPTPLVSPVLETLPVAEPLPTYRAIPGPKTTTHHVSVGYAFPQPRFAKLHAHVPHAHLHATPLTLAHHHHHHTLF